MRTAFLFLLLAAPAFAQLDPEPLPAPPPLPKTEDAAPAPFQPAPVAQALELALGATVWARVQVSTMGPVVDLTRLSDAGYYKRELIVVVLICAEKGKPLKEAVQRRDKGASLRELAAGYGVDYDRVFDAALAVEELVDEHYLPRFPERHKRRESP